MKWLRRSRYVPRTMPPRVRREAVSTVKRTPPPPVPFCVVATISHGYLRTMRVPEAYSEWLVRDYGWIVLIRDTEMPPEAHLPWAPQSNPRRTEEEADHDGA